MILVIMFVVYVIINKAGDYYIGQTNNLEKRLIRHNSGRSRYTKNKRPFKILYTETFSSRKEAMIREKEMKSGNGREWLKRYIIK